MKTSAEKYAEAMAMPTIEKWEKINLGKIGNEYWLEFEGRSYRVVATPWGYSAKFYSFKEKKIYFFDKNGKKVDYIHSSNFKMPQSAIAMVRKFANAEGWD